MRYITAGVARTAATKYQASTLGVKRRAELMCVMVGLIRVCRQVGSGYHQNDTRDAEDHAHAVHGETPQMLCIVARIGLQAPVNSNVPAAEGYREWFGRVEGYRIMGSAR